MNYKFIPTADPTEILAEIEAYETALESLENGDIESVKAWIEGLIALTKRNFTVTSGSRDKGR